MCLIIQRYSTPYARSKKLILVLANEREYRVGNLVRLKQAGYHG
jgi:hypothetical protein